MFNLKENHLRKYINKLIVKMLILLAVTAALSAVCLGLDFKVFAGLAVGFVIMLLCAYFMTDIMFISVNYKRDKAKRLIVSCYIIRYALIFGVCAAGYFTKALNPFAVIVPQFYLRIAIHLDSILDKGVCRK